MHLMIVGAHCGDGEIQAGAIAHKYAQAGHQVTFLHLTAGEKGTPPHMTPEAYRAQKIREAERAAAILGGTSITLNHLDAELVFDDPLCREVATIFRKLKPDVIITHWIDSMHPDHRICQLVVQDAWLKASLPGFDLDGLPPHGIRRVFHSENWEDMDGYEPDIYVDVSDSFETYLKALSSYWFIMHSTSFRYYDYYQALGTVRGCLARTKYAQTLQHSKGLHVRKEGTIPGFPLN